MCDVGIFVWSRLRENKKPIFISSFVTQFPLVSSLKKLKQTIYIMDLDLANKLVECMNVVCFSIDFQRKSKEKEFTLRLVFHLLVIKHGF